MSHARLAAGGLVSAALIDSLAAELIASGVVLGSRLADRIDAAAELQEPAGREVLRAFAEALRERKGPSLHLVHGGLGREGSSDEIATV